MQSTRDSSPISAQAAQKVVQSGDAHAGRSHIAKTPALSQLFTGEEVGDFHTVDLSKVQMFFFTIVVAVAYIQVLIGNDWSSTHAFPALSQGIVILIGISHAGYLTVASTNKIGTASTTTPAAPLATQPTQPAATSVPAGDTTSTQG